MDPKQFTSALRTALMQLDDFQNLQQNPLLPLLVSDDATGGPIALQQLLLDAIEALRQGGGTHALYMHDILYYRFAEGLTQKQVAFQLGISERQLRRKQANAIELLANHLLKRLPLPAPPAGPKEDHPAAPTGNSDLALNKEIAWLREGFGTETSQVSAELARAVDGASVLAQHYGVSLRPLASPALPAAAVPPSIIRQALLTVLTGAIPQVSGSALEIAPALTGADIAITMRQIRLVERPSTEPDLSSLNTTSQFLSPFAGRVLTRGAHPLWIEVLVPTVGSVPVLVIEDNPDTQQLFQRYAEHSRFRVIATADGENALALAQRAGVRVIILDLMMPAMDGWDFLARLRHHPATQHVPTVICSILPQEELAGLLGATSFLQKPVSQQAFLETLDRLTSGPELAADEA